MKTFDEKDLITWSNKDKAVIGAWYYFSDSIDNLKIKIQEADTYELKAIIDNSFVGTFKNHCNYYYPCILPAYAVKDSKPKKKKNYRPCKTIKEFYEAVNNYGSDSFPNKYFTDEHFMYNLLGTDIHFRSRSTYVEYYSTIVSICKKDNTDIRVLFRGKSYLSFEQIFTSYEIELNGKWLPFGILED